MCMFFIITCTPVHFDSLCVSVGYEGKGEGISVFVTVGYVNHSCSCSFHFVFQFCLVLVISGILCQLIY
jgi:hypothetical protein